MPLQRKALERIGTRDSRLSPSDLPFKTRMPPLRHKLACIKSKLASLRECHVIGRAQRYV